MFRRAPILANPPTHNVVRFAVTRVVHVARVKCVKVDNVSPIHLAKQIVSLGHVTWGMVVAATVVVKAT